MASWLGVSHMCGMHAVQGLSNRQRACTRLLSLNLRAATQPAHRTKISSHIWLARVLTVCVASWKASSLDLRCMLTQALTKLSSMACTRHQGWLQPQLTADGCTHL